MTEQLLTSDDVQALTGIKSRVTLWRRSRDEEDKFPKPYKVGSHSTRWKLSELKAWMDNLETV
jgi:predicted DNA-binding transcriptional regulator AlpA